MAGGDYYGPSGLGEFTGSPVRVQSSARSHDAAVQLDSPAHIHLEHADITPVAVSPSHLHEARIGPRQIYLRDVSPRFDKPDSPIQ